MDLIIGVLGAVIGAFAGWFLNEWSTSRRERPKLCFQMVNTPESELIPKEYRTKTSESEFGIEIFNVGKTTVHLEHFSLCYENVILVDCFMEDVVALRPDERTTYTMMEQDTKALQRHCNQKRFEKCDVIAYTVDEKVIKGTLAVPIFAIRARDSRSAGNYLGE